MGFSLKTDIFLRVYESDGNAGRVRREFISWELQFESTFVILRKKCFTLTQEPY